MLELEQMKHEMQAAGYEDEHAERGGDEADGGHCRPPVLAGSGCSSRKRRATARNWPGASA